MQPNSIQRAPGTESAVARFLDALGRRDFDQLEACLAPDVWFRALLPKGQRESNAAHEVAATFRTWFGDETESELVHADHYSVAGRVFLSYRLRRLSSSAPGWHLVEQAGFCRIREDRIARLDIVCTGLHAV
jgi:ketosteroid isomerase-like protein